MIKVLSLRSSGSEQQQAFSMTSGSAARSTWGELLGGISSTRIVLRVGRIDPKTEDVEAAVLVVFFGSESAKKPSLVLAYGQKARLLA